MAEHEHGGAPAKNPCGSCPYRKDVPSGVWAASEYDKLPAFDGPTHEQPLAVFLCHQQDGRLCAGWVGCHDMTQSLGLRMSVAFGTCTPEGVEAALDYVSPVPLWESGAAAAEHGKADIAAPSEKARKTVQKVVKRVSKHGSTPLQWSDGTPVADDPSRVEDDQDNLIDVPRRSGRCQECGGSGCSLCVSWPPPDGRGLHA